MDMEALAEAVAAKIVVPAAEEIDYDRLSDMVVAKLPLRGSPKRSITTAGGDDRFQNARSRSRRL